MNFLRESEIPICQGVKAVKYVEDEYLSWGEPRTKFILYDEKNNQLTSVEYLAIKTEISEGLIAVAIGYYSGSARGTIPRWGFIDKTGKEVVPCEYDKVEMFSEGVAVVGNDQNQTIEYSFIDTQGKKINYEYYREAKSFSEGLAAVKSRNGYRWGYINKEGRNVTPFRYDAADSFSAGKAKVRIMSKHYILTADGDHFDEDGNHITLESAEAEEMKNRAYECNPDKIASELFSQLKEKGHAYIPLVNRKKFEYSIGYGMGNTEWSQFEDVYHPYLGSGKLWDTEVRQIFIDLVRERMNILAEAGEHIEVKMSYEEHGIHRLEYEREKCTITAKIL